MIKKILKDDLFKYSAFMFIATSIVNVFNLVYHLFMVRALTPVDYGILNSLIALFMLISQPAGTLRTVIVKFVSMFDAHNEINKTKQLLSNLGKKVLIISGIIFIIILILSPRISIFLQIPSWKLIAPVAAILFFTILSTLFTGSLQGMQEFIYLGSSRIIGAGIKLVLSVILVAIGFSIYGALFGLLISAVFLLLFPLFLTVRALKKKRISSGELPHHEPDINYKKVYKYFFPVSICNFCFMALTSMDVILVKHYFQPVMAGYYSIAQMVGKIILFLPGAISIVMFPRVSGLNAKGKPTLHILNKSLLYVGILCGTGIVASLLFPEYILRILTGQFYIECLPLVKLFAIAMGLYALVTILIFYHLSIHNIKFAYPLVFLTALQALLIGLFHNSLSHVLYILIIIAAILLIIGIKLARDKRH